MFFAKGEAFESVMSGVPADEIAAAQAGISKIEKILLSVPADTRNALIFKELVLAVKMAHAALRRAEAFLKNDADARAAVETEMTGTLKAEFAAVWRLSNREGGLAESLSFF